MARLVKVLGREATSDSDSSTRRTQLNENTTSIEIHKHSSFTTSSYFDGQQVRVEALRFLTAGEQYVDIQF